MTDDKVPDNAVRHDTAFGTYFIPESAMHRPAAKTVSNGGVWEPATILAMLMRANGGDIIQAGAFFGDMLPILSKTVLPGTMVWSFEPNFENYQCAEAVLLHNGISNVRVIFAGLAKETGRGALRIVGKDGVALGGASSFVYQADVETVDTPLVSLNEAIPKDRRVGVIQLDVEGFETPALAGAMDILVRDRPDIIVETEPTEDWFNRNLAPLGYKRSGRANINAVYSAR
ncbi:MAG: FkbM family methyltransferase [Pseudomonadota bacterium]